MLKTRVITALIGLVIAIIAITAGGYIFNGIILLLPYWVGENMCAYFVILR